MAPRVPTPRRGIRWWDRQGRRGGLVAGVGLALIEILVNGAALGGCPPSSG
jgi:hypothetical protein